MSVEEVGLEVGDARLNIGEGCLKVDEGRPEIGDRRSIYLDVRADIDAGRLRSLDLVW